MKDILSAITVKKGKGFSLKDYDAAYAEGVEKNDADEDQELQKNPSQTRSILKNTSYDIFDVTKERKLALRAQKGMQEKERQEQQRIREIPSMTLSRLNNEIKPN